jgi:hypothetical protein
MQKLGADCCVSGAEMRPLNWLRRVGQQGLGGVMQAACYAVTGRVIFMCDFGDEVKLSGGLPEGREC